MRERRGGNQVADRVDARHGGAHLTVDHHEAAFVHHHTRALEPDVLGPGSTADADDDHIDFEITGLVAAMRVQGECFTAVVPRDADAGLHRDAPLLERARDHIGHLLVDARQDVGQRFEDRHLAADIREVRRELTTDRAAADDRGTTRNLIHGEHVIRRQDALTVEVEPRDRTRRGARRENQRITGELRAVRDPHVMRRRVDHRAGAGDHR